MHKREAKKLQARKIQKIIINNSHHDKRKAEIISKMTRLELLAQLNEPVEDQLIPDIEKGEILIDPRGNGSLQKSEC
jgi:hypothetical protein